jgi:hypothetical protein
MILHDNKTNVDLLNAEPVAATIAQLLTSRPGTPMTVGVHGDWGAGTGSGCGCAPKDIPCRVGCQYGQDGRHCELWCSYAFPNNANARARCVQLCNSFANNPKSLGPNNANCATWLTACNATCSSWSTSIATQLQLVVLGETLSLTGGAALLFGITACSGPIGVGIGLVAVVTYTAMTVQNGRLSAKCSAYCQCQYNRCMGILRPGYDCGDWGYKGPGFTDPWPGGPVPTQSN